VREYPGWGATQEEFAFGFQKKALGNMRDRKQYKVIIITSGRAGGMKNSEPLNAD
jgi:hypothetical protein